MNPEIQLPIWNRTREKWDIRRITKSFFNCWGKLCCYIRSNSFH